MRRLPLAGVRVLDLSGRTGAYCGKILADLGADVVKVELPAGDRMRFLPPFRDGQTGPEAGLLFAYYHHNKRGITLDWERDESAPLLESLAGWAEVVLASPKGERGTVDRLRRRPAVAVLGAGIGAHVLHHAVRADRSLP